MPSEEMADKSGWSRWKVNKYRRIWAGMTASAQRMFLKAARSKKGIKRSAIPKRTYGALTHRQLITPLSDVLILTYKGRVLRDWYQSYR